MPVVTSEPRDLIGEIHDLDEEERDAAFHRWIELSKLVAPPTEEREDRDRPAR